LYLYLHGFASGPNSRKALFFAERYAQQGIDLIIPDFNLGGFAEFTISRQLQQAASYFSEISPETEPITLIGSSLGGWAALLLAEQYPQVQRLILLAPAIGFPEPWLSRLAPNVLQTWQQNGSWPVYHYIEKQQIPLSYNFVLDAQQYYAAKFTRSLPTWIFHGLNDEVVPIELSRNYVLDRSQLDNNQVGNQMGNNPGTVNLIELDSDHGLGNVLPKIWQNLSKII
jgi:uncharacterized protein